MSPSNQVTDPFSFETWWRGHGRKLARNPEITPKALALHSWVAAQQNKVTEATEKQIIQNLREVARLFEECGGKARVGMCKKLPDLWPLVTDIRTTIEAAKGSGPLAQP